jgi:hypothetical protein
VPIASSWTLVRRPLGHEDWAGAMPDSVGQKTWDVFLKNEVKHHEAQVCTLIWFILNMSRFQEDIHERKPNDLSHIGFCLKSPEQIEYFKKSFCDDPDRKDSPIKMLVIVQRTSKSYADHAPCLPTHSCHFYLKRDGNCKELKNVHFHRVACKALLFKQVLKSYANPAFGTG